MAYTKNIQMSSTKQSKASNKSSSTSNIDPVGIPKGDYIDRLREVQKVLGRFNYKSLYEYEYDVELSEEESTQIMNFWNFRRNDTKFLCRFEWMAEHIHMIPEVAKIPAQVKNK